MKRCLLLLTLLFAVWAATAAARRPTIFLIGDSTCATKKLDKQNPERGWGHMFPNFLDGTIAVENHAQNGRSTKSFRTLGHWATVEQRMQAGDYLIIQFGHNDGKEDDSVRYASPAQYAENLRAYVRAARDRGVNPVLLTPVARRKWVDGKLAYTHGDYPAQMKRIAAEEGVTLIDMEAVTRAWLESLGDEPSSRYFLWVEPGVCPLYPDGKKDNTHYNVRGARIVAELTAREFATALPELAPHFVRYDFVVAKDGSGDFFTLREAIDAIPDYCRDTTRILICTGTYREKISIPATKRNVVIEGGDGATISWDDYASKLGVTGAQIGTSGSATIYFGGDNWFVRGVTFENTAGRVGQAVAVQCLGSNIRFEGCRFLGDQDTLYLYGIGNRDGQQIAANSHITFIDCYIEGTTDFIFGSAAALFRNCEIHSKADSYITAASTCRGQSCGLVFERCRLTAGEGVTKCYLGRPWREYARTVFVDCHLGAHIRPEGWHDWNKPHAHKTTFYAESGSTGPGAASDARVAWSHQLSAKQAQLEISAFEK